MIRLTGLAGIAIISFSAIFVRLADVSPDDGGVFSEPPTRSPRCSWSGG